MSPRTAKPSAEPTARILDAAAELFAERGFDGAGVDEIARRAGVNKAMLYYHVGDKRTLFNAVVLRNARRVKSEILGALEGAADPRTRLEALLTGLARAVNAVPSMPPIMLQIVLRELASGHPRLDEEALAEIRSLREITENLLGEGEAAGVFRAIDPVVAHLLVVGGVVFVTSAARVRSQAETAGLIPSATPRHPEALFRSLADILLNGIAVTDRTRNTDDWNSA